MPINPRHFVPAALVSFLSAAASAQLLDTSYPIPTLDRWVYGFNQASPPGSETEATVFSPFGSPFESSFDNRDGQFLIGHDTGAQIPVGLGADRYRILSARLTARISRDNVFVYDATPDPVQSYYHADHPEYIPDADPGRPMELFLCGYRGGWGLVDSAGISRFHEDSPYSNGAPFPFPARGIRNVFAAEYLPIGSGVAIDDSNSVDDRREARPLSIGACAIAPGTLVPKDIDVVWDIDAPAIADAMTYLRRGLDAGRINLMVTSLVTTDQQSSTTPAYYTKEFPAAIGGVPARLELRVCVGHPADWDCSGTVAIADIFAFLTDWFTGRADFNTDGRAMIGDIFEFLAAWFTT